MSTTEATRIRADIDDTRLEVSRDIDALADKVTPSKIVERKTRKVRSALSDVKDRVMGVVGSAQEGVADGAEAIGDGATRAAEAVKGNPLTVGIVAFSVGWLASALIPASMAERRAADQVKEAAAPVMQQAGEVLAEAADNLREPAREAAATVTDAAAAAVETVRSDAETAATDVFGETGSGAHAGSAPAPAWDPATVTR